MVSIQIFFGLLVQLVELLALLWVMWVVIRIVGIPVKYFFLAIIGLIKR